MQVDDTSLPVELFFSARNLKDLDYFSKSDPFLKLSMQRTYHGNIDVVGRTETEKNTINPNWSQKIVVQYFFEMKQPIVVEVFDEDSEKNADYIGRAETTMGNIMGSYQQTLILDIQDQKGKNAGKVIIRAEKVEQSSNALMMQWKGVKIANVDSHFDFLGKSDPYLKFLKIRSDNTFVEIARTEVLHNNQEPDWKPISVPASRLLDLSNPISSFRVECWDFEEKGKEHKFIGEVIVSANNLKSDPCPMKFQLHNPKIKKPGQLILNKFQLVPVPNFIDYLKSGLQLSLVIAIDFTGSNGVATSPQSLHYMGNPPNQYQQVMKGIWQIIENYDSDKKIPAFGFGAKPHFPNLNQNVVNHCFPINDNMNNPEINGFGNLMDIYSKAVTHMQFAGPTYFAPLLKQSFIAAQRLTQSYSYQILLILTDGQIHDMAATKDIIVQNSNLPSSIIIVGIGESQFANMEELDGDGKGLYASNGQKCQRDIVQFVPYRKFNGNSQILTTELLRQIPNQVCQYFAMIGKLPQPAQPKNMQEMGMNPDKGITEAIFKGKS